MDRQAEPTTAFPTRRCSTASARCAATASTRWRWGLSKPANREAFRAGRERLSRPLRPDAGGEAGGHVARLARDGSPRRQPLLHPEDLGRRSGADYRDRRASGRHGPRRRSCATDWGRSDMAKLIGGLGTSHVPSIGAALDKGLRDTPDWKPFFDGYIPGQEWVTRAQARRRRRDLQRSRQLVLPRQGADLRGRLRRGIPARRRGLGAAGDPALQGRGRFLLALHRPPRREPLRPDDLPGDRGRPRHPGADGTVLGPPGGMARAGRADLRQRDPVPDPAAEPLLRDGPGSAPGHRELRRATSASSFSAPAACRISSRARGRASSTRRPTGPS